MVGGHVEGGGLGEETGVEGSRRGGDAAGGEDRGDDVEEVLEFVEVGLGVVSPVLSRGLSRLG